MKNKKILLSFLLFSALLALSACGKKVVEPIAPPAPMAVTGQTVGQSLSIKQKVDYPAMVTAESEATIAAKASGNLTAVKFKVGDKVFLGQELAKIDDVNSPAFNKNNFNTSQIKQAKLAVSQAEAAYNLAKSSYNSLLISSVKDLRQAEIASDQAAKGQSNLDITASESLKSATLAFETAKIAARQAELTLFDRQKLVDQNIKDLNINSNLSADSAVSAAGSLITSINNITALDDNNTVSIAYRSNLGALDSSSYTNTKQSYQNAKREYEAYTKKTFTSINDKVRAVTQLIQVVQKLTDDTRILFDKTIASTVLPPSSLSGPSLSGLQSSAAAYQAQASGLLNQMNGLSQALVNTDLNNTSLLDSLRQANELAKQQQASAEQALNNLKAGNTSQKDQAGFASSLAQNQYENLKVKIESQVSAARTQMATAEFQYNNAVVALQSLYDAHSVISPLNGTVTKTFIADGEAVSPGQPIITISQIDNIKVQFYVEPDNLAYIKPGLPVKVIDDKNNVYSGIVSAVSPQADAITRRFLVEVKLENSGGLFLGTVVTAQVDIIKTASAPDTIILPLSAIAVGQNSNSIFIFDNNKAQEVPVEIKEVMGELAVLKVSLPAETIIVVDGNKLLQAGADISLK